MGMEKHAAIESDKSKFFEFANSVNLRGASGEITIKSQLDLLIKEIKLSTSSK